MFCVRALVRALNDAKNYAQQGCAMQFNGITLTSNLIGLAAMVYDPLYHAREIETIKLSFNCTCKAKSAKSSNIS